MPINLCVCMCVCACVCGGGGNVTFIHHYIIFLLINANKFVCMYVCVGEGGGRGGGAGGPGLIDCRVQFEYSCC